MLVRVILLCPLSHGGPCILTQNIYFYVKKNVVIMHFRLSYILKSSHYLWFRGFQCCDQSTKDLKRCPVFCYV